MTAGMFRIPATVQKHTKRGNTLLIKGIATAPTIDRDNERMTPNAIQKMADSVNQGQIPIRIEHEDKFYTDVGIWKTATINDQGFMEVEGEVDTDLSLGHDIEVMLNKGAKLGMSIGGKVVDAALSFESKIGKSVRDYKDVILREITITKNPSVIETCVSISKSVKVTDTGLEYTPEAVSLAESLDKKLGNQHEAICSDIQKAWHEKNTEYIRKMAPSMARPNPNTNFNERNLVQGWPAFKDSASVIGASNKSREKLMYSTAVPQVDAIMKSMKIEKDCDIEGYDAFDGYSVRAGLSSDDLDIIVKIAHIFSQVDIQATDMPSQLQDWSFVDSLPIECFVVELEGRWFPHQNADFSVNMDWVKYYLFQLISGNYSWLTPKEYVASLCHLFQHYKMDTLSKSGKSSAAKASTEVTKAHVSPLSASDTRATFSEEAMNLLQKCYQFWVIKSITTRPQYQDDGGVMNDLSDKDIKKMASAYSAMMQDKSQRQTLGAMMSNTYRNQISSPQPKPENGMVAKSSPSTMTTTTEEIIKEAAPIVDADELAKAKKKKEEEDAVEAEKAKKKCDEEEDDIEKKKKKCDEEAEKSKKETEASSVTKAEIEPTKSTEVVKAAETDVAKDVVKATDEASSASQTAGESVATAEATEVTKTEAVKTAGETVVEADVTKTGATVQESAQTEVVKATPEVQVPASKEVDVAAVAKASAVAAAQEAVEKSVTPALKTLTDLVTALQKSIEDSKVDVQKSVKQTEDSRTKELEEVKKTVSEQDTLLKSVATLVTKIGQLPNVKKSFASETSFNDLQKKFSEGDNAGGQVDIEKAVDTFIKEHPGCAVHTAYAEVRKAMLSSQG